ncbi:hypothetical protein [Micromonospora rubida]|uniref:hypothetical protein n=1 Tax=Micromonospora rubida TaxID=2697657 RepID=UPI001377B318|nr:hypothetical protein [Micromonospora rubida]NBE84770.1 hypothetical protein [Micromonospora rubida]
MTTTKATTTATHAPKPVLANVMEDDMLGTAGRIPDRKRRLHRANATAVLLTIVALAAAACSSSGDSGNTATTGASGAGSAPDSVGFATCMRENGLPSFPDPQPGKGMGDGIDVNSEAFKKAMNACKQLMPVGDPQAGTQNQWSSSDKLKYAQCMRENGVPSFPDPAADGGFKLDTDPNFPQFKAAETACAKYQPESMRNQTPKKPGGGS